MKHAVPVAVAVGIAVLVTAVASIAKCYLNVEPGAISAGIAACGLWVALRVALNWRNQLVTARRLDAVQEYWTAVQLLKHQVGAFKEGVKRLAEVKDGSAACRALREAQRDLDARWQAYVQANARVWPYDKAAEKHLRKLETPFESASAWCYDVLGSDAAPRTACEGAPQMATSLNVEELRLRKVIRQEYGAGK